MKEFTRFICCLPGIAFVAAMVIIYAVPAFPSEYPWDNPDEIDRTARSGDYDAALNQRDREISRYAGASDSAGRLVLLRAQVKKMNLLGAMGRYEDVLRVYGDVSGIVGLKDGEEVRYLKAIAGSHRITALYLLKRYGESVNAAEEAIKEFGSGTSPLLAAKVAKIRLVMSRAMRYSGRTTEALGALEGLVKIHGKDMSSGVRRVVAEGMQEKARLLAFKRRVAEAISAYDELVAGYKGETDRVIRRIVAKSGVERQRLVEHGKR